MKRVHPACYYLKRLAPTRYERVGFSVCQKSLAEFRVRRRERGMIRFLPRHVRGRKHFARSERRIVRCQRTTEAQNAAEPSRKSGFAAFSTVSPPRVYNVLGLCTFAATGQTMRFVRRPMPSISISTTSPFFSHGSFFPFSSATPLGVPVKMRSPGSSAIYREA